MTADLTRQGPGFSRSQKIGDVARSALYANKPDHWILGESPGDDFGYDFQVTVFDPAGKGAQCTISIQLKGTTQSDARLVSENCLSYSFNCNTLNLWHRSGFAVLVVIVDLIDTEDPKVATVHYHFVSPELDDILNALPPDQKTLNLRVPINQKVHKDLNILPELLPYLDEMAEGRKANREQKRASGTTTSDSFSIGISEPQTSLNQVFVTDQLEALIAASPKAIDLQAALAALRIGEYEQVLRLCPQPTSEACNTKPQDTAIAAHLRSMALDAIGEEDAADILILLAESLLPNCDDIVGSAAHMRLNALAFGNNNIEARNALLKTLEPHTGLSVTSVKSKILALNGKFDEARKILKLFPPEKAATTEIIISIIERTWERVLVEVAAARALTTLRPKQKLLLDILEARAQFELAFHSVTRPQEGDFIIPSTGLPNIDYDILRLAYDASRRAMLSAQRLNWPSDIQYIIDVFPASSMILGHHDEAMSLMASLGLARATLMPIREAVSKIAVQLDQPEIALQLHTLAGSSPQFDNESSVLAVASFKAGHISQALDFVTDDFLSNPSSKEVYLSSLLVLGMAADSTLRTDLLEKIRLRLDKDIESRHFLAILDSANHINKNLLQRSEAIQKLYGYWSTNNKPTAVGYHLLININPNNTDEARLFVDIAENIEVENSLGAEHFSIYGQALLTLERINDAIIKLQSASAIFPGDAKIKSLLGISLEKNGQSSEAFSLFEQLLTDGKASNTARDYFVEIAVRMGFFDRAEQQIRAAYANASTHSLKMMLLSTLFNLLLAEGTRPELMEETSWEFGRQAAQSDEREEGTFIQQYLFVTLRDDISIKPERLADFQRRLDAYSTNFPKSKILWRTQLPTDGPPEEMLDALLQSVGITKKDLETGKVTEQKMDGGALEIPFSWRPRRFLRNISDIFMLWEIRKNAPIERASMHFRSNISGYNRQLPQDIGSCEAVLSLTSLLLLDELDLLVLVLDTFPRLLVARTTLIALQEARHSFTGGWGRTKATRIIEHLQKYFSKISHPPQVIEAAESPFPDWHQEEKHAMEQPNRAYFSDDIVETYFVCNAGENIPPKPSISTIDFLSWADQSQNIVTPYQVTDAIGHILRLRVMAITVEQRYLLAAIPDELNLATSQAQAEQALVATKNLHAILNGIWNHFKLFSDLRTHFSANMIYLLNHGEAKDEVLIFLWTRWLGVVRFQEKPDMTPLEKMLNAFLIILSNLNSDKQIVSRHWHTFWTAIQRGLSSDLKEPADQVAIKIVGNCLGSMRANAQHEEKAQYLFEKAKIGLESGTQEEALLNSEYVEAVAQQVMKKL